MAGTDLIAGVNQMHPVGSDHALRAAAYDRHVQVVSFHPELPRDVDRGRVERAHIVVAADKVCILRTAGHSATRVNHRCGGRPDDRSSRAAQPVEDLAHIFSVRLESHRVCAQPAAKLQIVQAHVDVHQPRRLKRLPNLRVRQQRARRSGGQARDPQTARRSTSRAHAAYSPGRSSHQVAPLGARLTRRESAGPGGSSHARILPARAAPVCHEVIAPRVSAAGPRQQDPLRRHRGACRA